MSKPSKKVQTDSERRRGRRSQGSQRSETPVPTTPRAANATPQVSQVQQTSPGPTPAPTVEQSDFELLAETFQVLVNTPPRYASRVTNVYAPGDTPTSLDAWTVSSRRQRTRHIAVNSPSDTGTPIPTGPISRVSNVQQPSPTATIGRLSDTLSRQTDGPLRTLVQSAQREFYSPLLGERALVTITRVPGSSAHDRFGLSSLQGLDHPTVTENQTSFESTITFGADTSPDNEDVPGTHDFFGILNPIESHEDPDPEEITSGSDILNPNESHAFEDSTPEEDTDLVLEENPGLDPEFHQETTPAPTPVQETTQAPTLRDRFERARRNRLNRSNPDYFPPSHREEDTVATASTVELSSTRREPPARQRQQAPRSGRNTTVVREPVLAPQQEALPPANLPAPTRELSDWATRRRLRREQASATQVAVPEEQITQLSDSEECQQGDY